MNGLCVWFPTMGLQRTKTSGRDNCIVGGEAFSLNYALATVDQRHERTQSVAEKSMLCARAVIAMDRGSCHFATPPLKYSRAILQVVQRSDGGRHDKRLFITRIGRRGRISVG